MGGPLQYTIRPKNPAAHLFEISVSVDDPDEDGQAFRFAAWAPGSYMIRDFARNVVSIAAVCDGQPLTLEKTDKSTWLAPPCRGPLTLTAEIYAYDLNVRGACLDASHAFFDGATVFPAVVGREDRGCVLDILAPPAGADWRVATSMQADNAEPYSFGTYRAGDWFELIDHPVEMGNFHLGEFEVAGIPHAIAVTGQQRFDMPRICHDLARLCETQIALLGKPANLDRYLFLATATESGYGGLEHRWSSALICSRGDLPQRGVSGTSDDYRKFLGLCSHEYFHLWNVKRMKPERFMPYDLGREVHTGLLWVFEGITSYYDDLFLARSGLITAESFLELLGRTITRVLRTPGRLRQSVEESSFDSWTRFYKQDANSPNAIVSYYAKGSLVALALDLTIRKDTANARSLDDVMRAAWSEYGETERGMPERGLESIARRVTGLELEDFFERYVRGTADLPLAPLLKHAGVEMHLRAATGSADKGGKAATDNDLPGAWLGATLTRNGTASVFSTVLNGGPAETAGVAPGDEAVAFDGLRLTADNIEQRLRGRLPGDRVDLAVFRDHRLMRFKARLAAPPEDTCYLTVDGEADEAAAETRKSWLGASEDL